MPSHLSFPLLHFHRKKKNANGEYILYLGRSKRLARLPLVSVTPAPSGAGDERFFLLSLIGRRIIIRSLSEGAGRNVRDVGWRRNFHFHGPRTHILYSFSTTLKLNRLTTFLDTYYTFNGAFPRAGRGSDEIASPRARLGFGQSLVDRQNRGLRPRCRGGDPNWFPNRGNFPERRASYINYLVITDYPCPCASTRPARKRRKATLAIVIDRSELSESWKELNRVTEAPICIHLSVYTISDTNCNCEYVSKALRKQSSGRTNFTFAIAFCVFIFSSLSLLISIASNEFLLSNRTRFFSFFFSSSRRSVFSSSFSFFRRFDDYRAKCCSAYPGGRFVSANGTATSLALR